MAANAKAVPVDTILENIIEEVSTTTTTPTTTAPSSSSTVVDDFELEALRLPQSFIETAGVKKLLTTVPVRKPNQHDFNRVHPDQAYRANLAVIRLRDERDETFLLTSNIASNLPGEFAMATVFTAVNRQGVLFLWPVMLPQPDGRMNEWHRSAALGGRAGRPARSGLLCQIAEACTVRPKSARCALSSARAWFRSSGESGNRRW